MRFAATLLSFAIFSAALSADELRTLGGKNVTGTLSAITDTDVTLKTDTGPVATPMSQVLALSIRPAKAIDPGARYSDVRLIDDTVLHCKSAAFQDKHVELTLLSGAVLKLPMNFVVSFVRDAQNTATTTNFEAIAAKRIKRDRIVILRDKDLNVLEGVLSDVNGKDQTIKFTPEATGAPRDIPIDKLHGFIYTRTEAPSETPVCKVFDTEGNSLMALKLALADGKLTVTTTFGATLTMPQDTLARFDFNMGKLTFLSDLEPAKLVEKSGIGLVNRYRRDVNLDGEPILLDRAYAKGLSVHAYTELEYNLAGKYKEFKAILGIDVRTGSDSQPKVTIYCDGVEQFSEVITAKKLRPLAINVKDITTLRIVVSSRNFLDLHDHVTLAEARVSQ